jgi:hypothetical protein
MGLAGRSNSLFVCQRLEKVLKTKIYGCDKRYFCQMKTKGQFGTVWRIGMMKYESSGFDLLIPDWCVGYPSRDCL